MRALRVVFSAAKHAYYKQNPKASCVGFAALHYYICVRSKSSFENKIRKESFLKRILLLFIRSH
jgi:hypothetical protein